MTSKRVTGLVVVAGLLLAAPAMATPVYFENPAHGEAGHFHWAEAVHGSLDNWLDFTQPASAQPGVPYADTCLSHYYNPATPWGKIGTDGPGTALVEMQSFWLEPLALGDTVPSGASTGPSAYLYYEGYTTPWPAEDVPVYVGVHFYIGSDLHYGWIGCIRTGFIVEPFAWGYETDAGVPIAAGVPEPGTLALLAFGACAAVRWHR